MVLTCSLSFTLRTLPICTLFPYTTLFRSSLRLHTRGVGVPSAARHKHSNTGAMTRGAVELPSSSQHLHPMFHAGQAMADRKSTRLNSSHVAISYAVFSLKKKNKL